MVRELNQETKRILLCGPGAGPVLSLGLHFTAGHTHRLGQRLSRSPEVSAWVVCSLDSKVGGEPVYDWPGWPVFHVSGEARSVKSGKVAPEEDIDGQQEDSIDVADTSPERLLLNAGQLQL